MTERIGGGGRIGKSGHNIHIIGGQHLRKKRLFS